MANAAMMGWDDVGKIWRKLVCNAAGKLIIDPSEIFEDPPTDGEAGKAATSNWSHDHNADTSAHHSKYTDAEAIAAVGYNGTKYWSASGVNFSGGSPDIDDVYIAGEGFIRIDTGTVTLVAHVSLPHGAVVTNVITMGNAGATGNTWYLRRIKVSDKTYVGMATAAVNTADSSISYNTIDNSAYAYHLRIDVLDAGDEIWGAIITYTI